MNLIRKDERLAYFDALKCLGILLVINGHVLFFGMNINTYDSPSTLMLYSFKMPLFFFISGFFAFKENIFGSMDLKQIRNKFMFLVLPAIVFYCFLSLVEQGEGYLDFFVNGLGKYWFTFTLFEIFVIYYSVISLVNSKTMLALILIILAVVGVGYLGLFRKYDIAFFDFNHLAKYFQFFVIGVLSKMHVSIYDKFLRNEWVKFISISAFFVLLFILYQTDMSAGIYHFMRDIILRYLGLYIVISLFYCNQKVFNSNDKINKLILSIGQNSLAIYLLQYLFMPDFSAYNQWIEDLDWLTKYIISIGYTIVISLLCLAFIELLSNSKFLKKYALGKSK